MTKRDLVVQISNDTGMIQQDVLTVVQRAMDILSRALAQGHTIELRNFGVFEVKLRKSRIGRNPNAPEHDVRIPPRAVVKFKPGRQMRAEVLKLSDKIAAREAATKKEKRSSKETTTPVTH